MKVVGTQGLVDSRYRFLRTSALLILSLDIFYFFACYLLADLSGRDILNFGGLLQTPAQALLPVLLKYLVLGYAAVALPMVIHGRRLALTIESAADGSPVSTRRLESVESAFAHYRRTSNMMLGVLGIVNIFAAGYFISYGEFWLLALASGVGFACKLIVFPEQRRFNHWMWRALEVARGTATT